MSPALTKREVGQMHDVHVDIVKRLRRAERERDEARAEIERLRRLLRAGTPR